MVNLFAFLGGMVLAAFLSSAQAAEVAPTVKITDRPKYVAEVDYHRMEEAAEKKWREVLPRLEKNINDLIGAWGRLLKQREYARGGWQGLYNKTSDSRQKEDLWDMVSWCGNAGLWELQDMAKLKRDIAQEFARLDVRGQVCEEALPKQGPTPKK